MGSIQILIEFSFILLLDNIHINWSYFFNVIVLVNLICWELKHRWPSGGTWHIHVYLI